MTSEEIRELLEEYNENARRAQSIERATIITLALLAFGFIALAISSLFIALR